MPDTTEEPEFASRWDKEIKESEKTPTKMSHKSKVRSAAQKQFGGKY